GEQYTLYLYSPISLLPCVPVASFTMMVCSTGKFQIRQCVKVPFGASGSSIIKARLCVSFGILPNSSWGLMFSPSQVYFSGMCWPSKKAALHKVKYGSTISSIVFGLVLWIGYGFEKQIV